MSENLCFSDIFRGYKNGILGLNGVKDLLDMMKKIILKKSFQETLQYA